MLRFAGFFRSLCLIAIPKKERLRCSQGRDEITGNTLSFGVHGLGLVEASKVYHHLLNSAVLFRFNNM